MFDPKTNTADALAVISDTAVGDDLRYDLADETSRIGRIRIIRRALDCTLVVGRDVEARLTAASAR